MPLWIRAVGWAPLVAFPAIDLGLATANFTRFAWRSLARAAGVRTTAEFEPLRFRRLPFQAVFRWLERNVSTGVHASISGGMPFGRPLLYQRRNVALGALRPLLREGSTDEPRATAEQFARWLRRGRMFSSRIRHDVAAKP